MRFLPLVLLFGCSIGLTNTTKSLETDTGVDIDTADTEETDTDTDTDTTDTDTQPSSENPNAGECDDNIDNDGDGSTDCDDTDCVAAQNCQDPTNDSDGDGYIDDDDCNPYNPYVNPGASEIPNNGLDDDCDGITDEGSGGTDTGGGGTDTGNSNTGNGTICADTCTGILGAANNGTCEDGGFNDQALFVGSLILGSSPCAFGSDCSDCGTRIDADGDFHEPDPSGLGLPFALYFDCDDTNPNVNSSATEIPGNGIDEDCDGSDGSAQSLIETSCVDAIDNDADGDVDCDDTDCSSDPACSSASCPAGEIEDCIGNCFDASWLGDGYCDEWSFANLNCAALNYDDGDCP